MVIRKRFYDRFEARGENDFAWPGRDQKLFRGPTESTPDDVIADIDWLKMFSADLSMPTAYKEAGDFLVEALRLGGDGTHPDRFAFPILYLYRHGIELRLKELIRFASRVGLGDALSDLEDVLKAHNLWALWTKARSTIEQRWPKGDLSELDAMEKLIQELHAADKSGQHLRYSHGQDGKQLSRKLPPRLDLLHTRSIFDGMWNMLSGCIDDFEAIQGCIDEAHRDIQY